MLKNLLKTILSIVLFFCISLCHITLPEEFSHEAKYGMKKIGEQGFLDYCGTLAFVPVSSKSNIAFARDELPGLEKCDLKSFVFTNSGKIQALHDFADITNGSPYLADAIWLGEDSDSSSPDGIPHGLVFVLFSDVPRINVNKGGTITLAVARFEENGIRLGEWKDLITFTIHPNWRIDGETLRVAVGNGQIGVAFSLPFGTNVPRRSEAYFLRTDFQGNQIGKTVKLKLPQNGKNHSTWVYRPLWTGTRWLIPSKSFYCRYDMSFEFDRSYLFIFASTDDKAKKFRRKMLAQSNPGGYEYFRSLSLVHGPFGANQEDVSLLFVQKSMPVPWDKQKLESMTYEYFLYRLNKSGKKIGKPIEVMIPKLKYSFDYDPTLPYGLQDSLLSDMIIFDSQAKTGEMDQGQDAAIYIAQAHTLWNYRKNVANCEQQVNLYQIYPEDGSVAQMGNITKKMKYFRLMTPLIARSGKMTKVLTNAYYSRYPDSWDSYISMK